MHDVNVEFTREMHTEVVSMCGWGSYSHFVGSNRYRPVWYCFAGTN
jgi:hypothetical protein